MSAFKTALSRGRIVLLIWLVGFSALAQSFQKKTFTENGYTYTTVEGDPTETRIYKLANGLTVYLSVLKDKPQIFTLIPVRAGSKNDPSDNTGLAHYLEHMVFKGTSKIGSKDYAKEKVLLDSIERMFNRYRKLKDPSQRKALYKKIDKVSLEASKLCYANEYDKMVGILGAQGTNAFTSVEQTVYMNAIPSNQLEKWLLIEKERFSELVPRLFHTELEAVYEEKNISLDNDGEKVMELLNAELFKKHPYGTQTTIGTIAHLKNPSITEIKKYFYTYYVPNNMAICLAGDLDPAKTIALIDKTFGQFKPKPVPTFVPPVEAPIAGPVIKKVIGPEEESLTIGYRLPGKKSREALLAKLLDNILSNNTAGLMDLNLNQTQKVLSAYSYLDQNKDYSVHILGGNPRNGQSLKELRQLLLAQLDSVKQGKFEDWLIPAIVNNIKISQLKQFDGNQGRAFAQMNAFIHLEEWDDVWKETEEMAKITKAELMAFAAKNYSNNYVAIEKVTGKDPKVLKIEKPSITPVALNKDGQSAFFKEITAIPSEEVQPVFLNFQTDLSVKEWKPGIQLLYKKNTSTPLFTLTYLVEMGRIHNSKLEIAAQLLDLCGTSSLKAAQFKKELFKLGTEISVFPGIEQTYVTLTGLQENFESSIRLLESLINSPKSDAETLEGLRATILKERENSKLDKRSILGEGVTFAKYGSFSPSTIQVKNKDLAQLSENELLDLIKKLPTYSHKILYYGPAEESDLMGVLNRFHQVPATLNPIPAAQSFTELETDSNRVYWIDYDMVQTEMNFISKSTKFDPAIVPKATLFNEYMGGNMSSVVFQELRESKALAYSASGGYRLGADRTKSNYISSYIGCQADKLPEALPSMLDILENLPLSEHSLELSKKSILGNLRSERITKSNVFFAYLKAQKQGINYDIRKNIFEEVGQMGIEQLKQFHTEYIKGKKYSLVLVGKRDKISFPTLRKFGSIRELKVDEVFGY